MYRLSPPVYKRSTLLPAGAFTLFALILIYYWSEIQPSLHTTTLSRANTTSGRRPDIPNIVHYVQIVPEDGSINFDLLDFVTVYSSQLYFNPDVIYIHTDATTEAIEMAKGPDAPNKWTHKIFNLATVVVNQVIAPTHADNGQQLLNLPHRSDMVRANVSHEFGGIYFDFDVIPIRDFAPLRTTGFANVVGTEKYAMVGAGIVLSIKGSELMRVWLKFANIVYDGGWITHSNILLTNLVHRVSSIPYEILTLDKLAFSPSSWEVDDCRALYGVHGETPVMEPRPDPLEGRPATAYDIEILWQSLEGAPYDGWEANFADSFAIHAFDQNLEQIAEFPGMSMEYLLARQSNLARAVYLAVKHAIDAGILSPND